MIMMFENKVVAIAVTLLLLSSTASVFGESSTTYYVEGSGSEEKTISLDGENEDSSVSIKFPATEALVPIKPPNKIPMPDTISPHAIK